MQRLLPFLVLADIALVVVAMFDCVTSDDASGQGLPKRVWLVLILLLSPIGPIMWFVTRHADERAAMAEVAEDEHRLVPLNQVPPDDDPDFLRDLSLRAKEAAKIHHAEADRRRADEERLRKWEADLRAREDRLREGKAPTTPEDSPTTPED